MREPLDELTEELAALLAEIFRKTLAGLNAADKSIFRPDPDGQGNNDDEERNPSNDSQNDEAGTGS